MKCYTEITAESVVQSSETWDEVLDFIVNIDKGVMGAGFTEQLISALVKSLSVDYTADEMAEFLESLK